MSNRLQGTNSPPLEATGTINPIGKVDKTGRTSEGVSDAVQRKGEQDLHTLLFNLLRLNDSGVILKGTSAKVGRRRPEIRERRVVMKSTR